MILILNSKKGTINFKENGYVESGILREDTELQYNHDKWATFAKDTMVTFNSKGYVRIGPWVNTPNWNMQRQNMDSVKQGSYV